MSSTVAQIASLAWALTIWWLSAQPGTTPSLSLPFPHIDKLVHAAIFGILAGLVFAAMRPLESRPRLRWWIALVLAALWGAVDELHQSFVPGRTPDFYDWLADVTGATLALLTIARSQTRLPLDRGFVR